MEIVVISASFVPSTAANSIEVMKVAHALAEIGHDVTLIESKPRCGMNLPFGMV
jgi:fumarate hydratase class II